MALTNSQYNSILRMYDDIQARNRALRDERMHKLYIKEPRFAEIDRQIATASISCATQMIEPNGNANTLDSLKDTISKCHQEKLSLLKSMGLSPDYLEISYDCPDCKDTGFIGTEKCHCFKQKSIDLLYQQSDLRDIIKIENFDNFDLNVYSKDELNSLTGVNAQETAANAFKICKEFAANFGKSFENIFLCGNVGIGKTYLTHCIAAEVLKQGHSVVYIGALRLFELFNAHIFSKDVDVSEEYDNIFTCDLLIIDDLGTEISSSATVSQLFACLNDRLLAHRSTVISTNLSITQLDELYSERTASRIFSQYQILRLFGEDIRIKKKLAQVKKS